MRLNQLIQEFDQTMGSAMATFVGQVQNQISQIISNMGAEPVDITVDKVYKQFYDGFAKAVKDNPAMKQKLDVYYKQFIGRAFDNTIRTASDGQDYQWKGAQWISLKTGRIASRNIAAELGLDELKNYDRTQLARDGKINKPYIKKLIKNALSKMPAPKGVGVSN